MFSRRRSSEQKGRALKEHQANKAKAHAKNHKVRLQENGLNAQPGAEKAPAKPANAPRSRQVRPQAGRPAQAPQAPSAAAKPAPAAGGSANGAVGSGAK